MKNTLKLTLLSAALGALLLPAAAQSSGAAPQPSTAPAPTSPSTSPNPGTSPSSGGYNINQHKENQQDRISNDIQNGKLSAGEAGTLEKQESNLNHEEQNMRKLDNGHLTAADRAALKQQQGQLSNEISKDAHNGSGTNEHPTTETGEREKWQQDRIGSGLKNGKLDAAQASQLEGKENAISQEVKRDRQANGGKLTAQEKQQINRQQNKLSKQIYKDKHHGK